MKISKILIANRGEIALRVIKTCKRLGIETVTIYASDDARLPHASAGDENIALGRGALSETYLNADKIIKIAQETKAQAIHPGYVFYQKILISVKKCKKRDLFLSGQVLMPLSLWVIKRLLK